MIEKPKITKGEWSLLHGWAIHTGDSSAENFNFHKSLIATTGTNEEDAKAISAVPNLIDALIKSYELTTRELAEETGTSTDELVELATLQEEALEKAGCKLL